MPELAEVHRFAHEVNEHGGDRVFVEIVKSEVHKLENNFPKWRAFTLKAQARGKEAIVTITRITPKTTKKKEQRFFLFKFGMTGSFQFFAADSDLHKHAHVIFRDAVGNAVAFVDQRRFGRWEEVKSASDWGDDRGPDPVYEYAAFCQNVVDKVVPKSKYWNRPLCEVLLMQEVFNGIGNYLRAEILAEFPQISKSPFTKASHFFETLTAENAQDNRVLQLCRDVPLKFMESSKYLKKNNTDEDLFEVYARSDSKGLKDSNSRMFWYKPVKKNSKDEDEDEEEEEEEEFEVKKSTSKKKKKKAKKRARAVAEHEKKIAKIEQAHVEPSAPRRSKRNKPVKEESEEEPEEVVSKKQQKKVAAKVNSKKKAKSAQKTQRRRKRK